MKVFKQKSHGYKVCWHSNREHGDRGQFPAEAKPEEKVKEHNVQQVVLQMGTTETNAILCRCFFVEGNVG